MLNRSTIKKIPNAQITKSSKNSIKQKFKLKLQLNANYIQEYFEFSFILHYSKEIYIKEKIYSLITESKKFLHDDSINSIIFFVSYNVMMHFQAVIHSFTLMLAVLKIYKGEHYV